MPDQTESIWYKVLFYGLEFLGRYYSTYRGFVVDNNDPEKLNRVRVIFPSLVPDDKVGVWAFPKGQWGAENYGIQMLPRKGDMVFIEFDHGDLDYPIWQYAGYGEKEKPKEFDSINVLGLKTPNGTLISIDDGQNKTDGQLLVNYKTGKEYYLIEKDLFELESLKINIGKDAQYKAVLGEVLNTKLDAICEKFNTYLDLFASHTHASNGAPAAEATQIPFLKVEIEELKQSFTEILSNKVNIGK